MTVSTLAGSPLTGPSLPGRLRIIRELGRGGMAVVYHCFDTAAGREVAVKVIAGDSDQESKLRFQREAADMAVVFHPNVVDFYSLGDCGEGQEFIEMEYVDGGTLQLYLRACPTLGPLLEVFAKICDGLEYFHQKGLVHRDLKPANVLMSSSGVPKISDLGIARRTGGGANLTGTGVVMGTASYLSPEQIMSHPVGPRSDLYSLGICLFEAVTGQHPFSTEKPLAVIRAHLQDKPALVSSILPGLPQRLVALIDAMLSKDPEARPASAAVIATDLRDILASLTPEQNSLTSNSFPAQLSLAERRLEEGYAQEAMLLLQAMQANSDPELLAKQTVLQAQTLLALSHPGALDAAELAVAVCQRNRARSISAALLVLGQAATREQGWGRAYEALTNARKLIPSAARRQQIAMMESWAELHERGHAAGQPDFSPQEAERYREIANGLRQREESQGRARPLDSATIVPLLPDSTVDSPRATKSHAWLMVASLALLLLIGLGMAMDSEPEQQASAATSLATTVSPVPTQLALNRPSGEREGSQGTSRATLEVHPRSDQQEWLPPRRELTQRAQPMPVSEPEPAIARPVKRVRVVKASIDEPDNVPKAKPLATSPTATTTGEQQPTREAVEKALREHPELRRQIVAEALRYGNPVLKANLEAQARRHRAGQQRNRQLLVEAR